MNTQEIFYLIAIIALVITNAFVIALIYFALRFVIKTKKSFFEFIESGEAKELLKKYSGKGKNYEDEDFDNGYITGIKEILQQFYNDFPTGIDVLMKEANYLVKNWGHYEISQQVSAEMLKKSGIGLIIFVEKASKEQENEARD